MTVEQGMTDEQAIQLNHYLCGDCLHVDDAESIMCADGDDSLSTATAQVRFTYNRFTILRFFLLVLCMYFSPN